MTPPEPIRCAAFLIASFVAAGVAQTAWLRSSAGSRFQRPLDGGRCWRGRRWFGDSKTWKGFIVMVPAVGLAFLVLGLMREYLPVRWQAGLWSLSPTRYLLLGMWAGFWFMAGELPNSFIKRQLDVPSGGMPRLRPAQWLCFVLDQIDSILAALIALAVVVPTPPLTAAILLVIGAAVHWLFNLSLFLLGIKSRPA